MFKTIKSSILFLNLVFLLISCSVGSPENNSQVHIHTYSSDWSYNESHHWHNSTCGHDVVSGKGEHSWDDGTIEKEASLEDEGIIKYKCKICNYEKSEILEKLTYKNLLIALNKWNARKEKLISF